MKNIYHDMYFFIYKKDDKIIQDFFPLTFFFKHNNLMEKIKVR